MKYLTMTGFTVRTGSDRWTLGYEGENNSRILRIKTTDDLTDFATVNLLIDTLDCGAMTVETVSNYKVLSMVLTAGMLGEAGKKTCQLLMMDSEGTVIKKSNQFQMVVNTSNTVDGMAPDSPSVIIITDYIEEKVNERISDEFLEGKINDWLDDHPEATTTVQDNTITTNKIVDNAITNDKLAEEIQNPWYLLKDINLFGLRREYSTSNLGYVEALTYDTTHEKYYLGTSECEILVIDGETLDVLSTYNYDFNENKIGALSYNPDTDQIYVSLTGSSYRLYAIDASTMQSQGELTNKVFSVGVQYDIQNKENVALQLSGTTAEIRTYDEDFDETGRYVISIEETDFPQQDFCVKNGIIYVCTLNSILEMDYKHGKLNRLGLSGILKGNEEPEGIAFGSNNITIASHKIAVNGRCGLYEYGFSSSINLVSNQLYYVRCYNISEIIGDYPALFDFIESMDARDMVFLYHYGPTNNFSDLPNIKSTYVVEIFVNRPTNSLEYTQIELSMHDISVNRAFCKRWRGIIKRADSNVITWVPYNMDTYGIGEVVPTGSDLNDYVTPGVYAVTSSSSAANIDNMPVSTAGRLEVRESIASGTGEYIIQTFYRSNTQEAAIYNRVKTTNNSGFGAWKQLNYVS